MSYLDEIPDGIALNATIFEGVKQSSYVDGSTEQHRVKYEFDTDSEEAYENAWSAYPSAWDVYLGTDGVTFLDKPFSGSTEVEGKPVPNSIVLLQAISFYIYTEGEDVLFSEAQQEKFNLRAVDASDGLPLVDDGRTRTFGKYNRDEGSGTGTYENPDAFYNPEVYDSVVSSDGFIPRVTLSGDQKLSEKYQGRDIVSVMSTDSLDKTEYESVISGPSGNLEVTENSGFYDWGSPYAGGGRLAREV